MKITFHQIQFFGTGPGVHGRVHTPRARDPEHIRVITQKNAGQGKARNVGLAAATGEYVGFVDSDDYVDRRMYAAMYTRAGSEELDLVEFQNLGRSIRGTVIHEDQFQ